MISRSVGKYRGRILKAIVTLGLSTTLVFATAPAIHADSGDSESHSTAQAVQLNLGGLLNVAASSAPTAANNDGTQSITPVKNTPAISLLNSQSLLKVGALSEIAQADTDGSSYSCAGVLSPGATIAVGDQGRACSMVGSGSGGLTLDLSQLLGSDLPDGIVSIKLVADAIVAHSHDDGRGAQTGSATLAGLKVRVEVLDGILGGLLGSVLPPIEVPVKLTGDVNENVLQAVIASLTGQKNPLLGPVIDLLAGSLTNVVDIRANYQRTSNGVLNVSGLHIGVLNDALLYADIANVTVGKNMAPTDCRPFPDVTETNPFCHDIDWLKIGDMTRGYSDGNYRPTAPVTRQAMSAFLYRFANENKADPTCTAKPFPDVLIENDFCGPITWMQAHEIGRGYDDGTFGPVKSVSRQATAAFLYRITHNGESAPPCTTKPFDDVAVSNEFCGAIAWFKEKGIADGYSATEFGITKPVSRQAMAAWIHRYSALYPRPTVS